MLKLTYSSRRNTIISRENQNRGSYSIATNIQVTQTHRIGKSKPLRKDVFSHLNYFELKWCQSLRFYCSIWVIRFALESSWRHFICIGRHSVPSNWSNAKWSTTNSHIDKLEGDSNGTPSFKQIETYIHWLLFDLELLSLRVLLEVNIILFVTDMYFNSS